MQLANHFSLDTQLINFSEEDAWSIRDACEGVQIFGSIGSGKTSGSGAALARSYLRAGFGGLVCCAKPEERKIWEQYARETGRENALFVVSPSNEWRFNFLNYEMQRSNAGGGITENIVNLFSRVVEIAEGKQDSGNQGGESFWRSAMREMLRNGIDLLSIAKGQITLEDICNLIVEAPQSLDDISNKEWRKESFCSQCFAEALKKEKTPDQEHDLAMASRYWLKQYPQLADRTRSSIVATFTSIADMLLHGAVWKLFCTDTTIVPEVTYKQGAVIILDMPIQEYQEIGRIAQGIFKYMFQRAILQRDAEVEPRPVFLWADEAQNFVSSYDYQYQAVARSARACTVYLTQNISNYYSVLGMNGRNEANALLGNFQTKIFHANSDPPTNMYGADTIGQDWTTAYSYTTNRNAHNAGSNAGGSDTMQYKVKPTEFTVLRKGGPANDLTVESILFQGGRIWNATGDTYMKALFKQG